MADARDILDLERAGQTPELSRESISGGVVRFKGRRSKRPEGMSREVFSLLSDEGEEPPLVPTDTGQGYKQRKAELGMKKVRPWKWTPFKNPARTDGAVFHHWQRVEDEGKDYPFAQFNKKVDIPTYEESEYVPAEGWTKEETDHLFDLCRRFDLRFFVVHDRWDRESFPSRSIEDLKERYYGFCGELSKRRGADPGKVYVFDADHERRRKEQLEKLYQRTPEQVEEEQMLLNELKKIDARKREREKKTQDLQKLITAADGQAEAGAGERRARKKRVQQTRPSKQAKGDTTVTDSAGIKFPDFKTHGTSLRSQRMKLPASVGQKKSKAIESLLQELGLESNPVPTEEICQNFNELRSDMVLMYELREALANCEYELQSLRHQYEALNPGQTLEIPSSISQPSTEAETSEHKASSSEIIDVVGLPGTSGTSGGN